MFDLELRRRLASPAKGTNAFDLSGPSRSGPDRLDLDAAIKVALENRADLRVLRAVYFRLTPETLPAVRDLIRTQPGMTGLLAGDSPFGGLTGPLRCWMHPTSSPSWTAPWLPRWTIRRQQLFDLIAERERQAADDVRAAAAAETRPGEAGRAGEVASRATDQESDGGEGPGPLVVLPAELEVYRATGRRRRRR